MPWVAHTGLGYNQSVLKFLRRHFSDTGGILHHLHVKNEQNECVSRGHPQHLKFGKTLRRQGTAQEDPLTAFRDHTAGRYSDILFPDVNSIGRNPREKPNKHSNFKTKTDKLGRWSACSVIDAAVIRSFAASCRLETGYRNNKFWADQFQRWELMKTGKLSYSMTRHCPFVSSVGFPLI